MPKGYAAPFVKVFTSAGEVTEKVTEFVYKYSQEADDTCQIRIEALDRFLADRKEFQEGAILSIIWGYIGEEKSMARKVAIRDIKASYTAKTIALDLLCTNLATTLKNNSNKRIWKDTTLKEVASKIAADQGLILEIDDGSSVIRSGEAETSQFKEDGNFTTARSSVANPHQFRIHSEWPQANDSDHQALQKMSDLESNGPWEVTGRDDKIIIRKIALSSKSVRTYTYADGSGELIDFFPETKAMTKKSGTVNINVNAFDPENKTAIELDANESNSYTPALADQISEPSANRWGRLMATTGISATAGSIIPGVGTVVGGLVGLGAQGVFELADIAAGGKLYGNLGDQPETASPQAGAPVQIPSSNQTNLADNLVKKFNTADKEVKNQNQPVDPKTTPENKPEVGKDKVVVTDQVVVPFREINTANKSFFEEGFNKTAIDETAVKLIGKSTAIDFSKAEHTVEDNAKDAHAAGSNDQAKKALEMEPAKLKVVGDPLLESGVILTVNGIAKKYSGNYYVIECTHDVLRGSGYLVTMELKRNAQGNTGHSSPDKTSVKLIRSGSSLVLSPNKQPGPDKAQFKNLQELIESQSDQPIKVNQNVINTQTGGATD